MLVVTPSGWGDISKILGVVRSFSGDGETPQDVPGTPNNHF